VDLRKGNAEPSPDRGPKKKEHLKKRPSREKRAEL